jgi:Rho termination factor, N-terminal domain
MAERTQTRQRRGASAGRNRSGNDTAKKPAASESDLSHLKVDELRQLARENEVTGTSGLRKDDLVKAVAKALKKREKAASGRNAASAKKATGGVRRGGNSSRSLQYSQEITSTGERPERPGRSLVTTDHDVIRQWAEQRGAVPATVEGSEHDGHLGVLRFDFPGGDDGGRLVQVSWDEWFATFDERGLNFIYQEERSDGRQSNFFQLENPDREDA